MDHDHVGPEQLVVARDPVTERLAAVDHELEIQVGIRTQALQLHDVAWLTSRRRRRKPK